MPIDGEIAAGRARRGSDQTKEILRQRVQERLDATGKSAHSVSKAIGANAGYVRDLLDPEKTGIPSAERLRRLAAELETTTEYLIGEAEASAQVISEARFTEMPQPWRGRESGGIPLLGTGFCDDLAVESADGECIEVERVLLEPDHVVRLIERPHALWAARDAYAIYLEGSSMEPRWRQGDLCIVDPRRPPGPGDDVVVQLNDGNGRDVVTVIVKELVRASSKTVELRQYKPEQVFRVPRQRVVALHRICTNNELFGV